MNRGGQLERLTRFFSLLEFFAPFGENKKRGVTDSKKGGSGQQKRG